MSYRTCRSGPTDILLTGSAFIGSFGARGSEPEGAPNDSAGCEAVTRNAGYVPRFSTERVLAVHTGEGRDGSPEFGAPSGVSSVSSLPLAGCLRPIRRAIPSPIRQPKITREAHRRTGRERLATVSTFSTTSSPRSISDSSSCAVSTRSWASDSNAAKSLTRLPPDFVDRWTAHGCLRFTLGLAAVRVSPIAR